MASYNIRRLLEKKGRTVSQWVSQEGIESLEDLAIWESNNSDFLLDEDFRKEVTSLFRPKKTTKRKEALIEVPKPVTTATEAIEQEIQEFSNKMKE